jgi:LEA14-like dessication related protein
MQTFSRAIVVASLLLVLSCASSIKTPTFMRVDKFRVNTIGAQQSRLDVTLLWFNPNPFPVELRKADVDVSIDQRPLGKAILDTIIHVPAKDSFRVPVRMNVAMKSLLPNLLQLAVKDEVELGMKGSVRVKRSGISMTIPVDYRGKQKIVF